MNKYFQPSFIKSQTINPAGLTEIVFKDESKYVGDMLSETIQGDGVLIIQDLGRIEGLFFDNKIVEGKFILKDWLGFEGRFDDGERIAEGTLTFKSLNKKLKVKTVDGKLGLCMVIDKDKEIQLMKSFRDYSYSFQDKYMIIISEDKTTITLQKTYGVDYLQGLKIEFNIAHNIIEVKNYAEGSLVGTQRKFSLESVPFYQEYEIQSNDKVASLYKVIAANGNFYTGRGGSYNGEVVINGQPYSFHGGIEGPYKTGSGYLEFTDGYKKPVSYIQDKLVFDDLGAVFNFVSEFKSTSVPGLSSTLNLDMIRLMENIDIFEGKIDQGTTTEPCSITFKDQTRYEGKLVNFKLSGNGCLYTSKGKISGNFEYGDISYGIIEYNSGARYEGQLQDFNRSGLGYMRYINGYEFSGRFINGVVAREGGKLRVPGKDDIPVIYIHIDEFEIGIFVTENRDLYVVDCSDESVYDARFIDELEKSGISIRESLKNISFDNNK